MDYHITFDDSSSAYLAHHGVLGMKWGVWNEETRARYGKNGGVLQKGTVVGRVAASAKDPAYFNKKHVSTTKSDHEKWVEYLGPEYQYRGINTYNVMYATTKDIRVASAKELGQVYVDKILKNSKFSSQAIPDTDSVIESSNYTIDKTSMADVASGHLAFQTRTGKALVDALLKEGYGAASDKHGTNVSEDPLIILNPNKNLKKLSVEKTRYWDETGIDWAPKEKKAY